MDRAQALTRDTTVAVLLGRNGVVGQTTIAHVHDDLDGRLRRADEIELDDPEDAAYIRAAAAKVRAAIDRGDRKAVSRYVRDTGLVGELIPGEDEVWYDHYVDVLRLEHGCAPRIHPPARMREFRPRRRRARTGSRRSSSKSGDGDPDPPPVAPTARRLTAGRA